MKKLEDAPRGHPPRDSKAVHAVCGRRGNNLTMVFAVSAAEGLMHHELTLASMTCARFNAFLLDTTGHFRNDDAEKVIIFDNAPAHRQAQAIQCPDNVTLKW